MSDCDEVKFVSPADKIGGVKKAPTCMPGTVQESVYVNVADKSVDAEPLPPLQPVIVGNVYTTASCIAPSLGSAVATAANTYTDKLYITTIEGITESSLEFIARYNLEEWISSNVLQENLDYETVANKLGISADVAVRLIAEMQSIQNTLNYTAQQLTNSMLNCVWLNDSQTAECSDPDMAKVTDHPDAVFSFTIPRGIITSKISQEDANQIAMAQAVSLLNCFYISDPVSINCTNVEPRPYPVMEPVPTDTEEIYPGLPLRVGSISLAQGVGVSTVDKATANREAYEYAASLLNCFYINDEIVKACDDPNARSMFVDPDTTEPIVADPSSSLVGQLVSIPQGMFTSLESTAKANQDALMVAEGLLECCFINEETYVECEDYVIRDSSGNVISKIPASQTVSPVFRYTVAKGVFSSCSSQEEADNLARVSAYSFLDCLYCNDIVIPTCVPAWVGEAVTTGIMIDGNLFKLSLPLDIANGITNPFTGKPEDLSKWSLDATIGMAADMYCSKNYEDSQQIAGNTGQTTVPTITNALNDCTFANDLVIAACSAVDPYVGGVTPSGSPYTFISKFPVGELLSVNLSEPKPNEYVEIPAGTVVVSAADVPGLDLTQDKDYLSATTKAYANQLAITMANTLLECIYANPVTLGTCSGKDDMPDGATQWVVGEDKLEKGLTAESNSVDNPLVIPEEMFTSKVSLQEVKDSTRAFVLSSIFCLYENEVQQAICPPGLIAYSTGLVPKGTITAESLSEANKQAAILAASMIACGDEAGGQGPPGADGADGAPGPPGADGKCVSGQCNGTCYGVYS